MESLWSLLTVVGPILLLAALLWAIMRNRASGPREIERTEHAAHDLRDRIDAEDKRDDAQR
ncbi:hypothetical protein GGR88_002414 [Sphingomonas jejuensis]|uniref:C-type cytochrome biogenesis protein CcmI n=1 Tax=Sphingomonas jejuensis TaxID=904715 RepID=A0ABX0XNQ0_9SPHN|nr:hypothetical protein [Sphingomonas jejuensis]NJC34900.1 hypothetical protein [Sphingomonas jejuensis]